MENTLYMMNKFIGQGGEDLATCGDTSEIKDEMVDALEEIRIW